MSEKRKTIKIRDPIYGFINLDDQETDIINSKYFQRLRRIKQLSLTDMVYPSANHTRFEHSLGVVQMATDMFDNIAHDPNNLKLLGAEKTDIDLIRKNVRLAALLHDVGHPPFSHAGEDALPYLPKGHPDYAPRKNKRYTHEHYSRAAIEYLFKDIIEDHESFEDRNINASDILFLLGGKKGKVKKRLLILKELLSSQIDADRADFLLRDYHHLGVNYGIYDRNMFVKEVTLGETTPTDDQESHVVIALNETALNTAESFVMARYQMYSQVYFHKVRRIFDYHIGKALRHILEKELGYKDGLFLPPTSKENIKEYFEIDDWTIQGLLKAGKGADHGEYILSRKHYKLEEKWEGTTTNDQKEQIKEYKKNYDEHYLDEGKHNPWYNKDKNIYIKDKEGKLHYLTNKSKFVRAIDRPRVTRFYRPK